MHLRRESTLLPVPLFLIFYILFLELPDVPYFMKQILIGLFLIVFSFRRIAKLFESGIFIKWKKDARPPDNECTTYTRPQAGDTRKINIAQMIGSFYILMFGLCGSLGALLIEYIYLTSKNKGKLPEIKGLQIKLPCCHSLFPSGKMDHDKKIMHSRMRPGMKEHPKSKRRRKNKKSLKMKTLHGADNTGIYILTENIRLLLFPLIFLIG